MKTIFSLYVLALTTAVAAAGTPSVPVSEPESLGLLACGAAAALVAWAKRRNRK